MMMQWGFQMFINVNMYIFVAVLIFKLEMTDFDFSIDHSLNVPVSRLGFSIFKFHTANRDSALKL